MRHGPRFHKPSPNRTKLGRVRPVLGPMLTRSGRIRPSLASHWGRRRPMSTKFGLNVAKSGQSRPIVARTLPKLCGVRPKFGPMQAKSRLVSAKVGPSSTKLHANRKNNGIRSTLAPIRQFGQIWTESKFSWPYSAPIRPTLGRLDLVWSGFGKNGPNSGDVRHMWAQFDQMWGMCQPSACIRAGETGNEKILRLSGAQPGRPRPVGVPYTLSYLWEGAMATGWLVVPVSLVGAEDPCDVAAVPRQAHRYGVQVLVEPQVGRPGCYGAAGRHQ